MSSPAVAPTDETRRDANYRVNARLILPAGSEIDGVDDTFDRTTSGLAAIDSRLLLAWLVDQREAVRLIRPRLGREPDGMD